MCKSILPCQCFAVNWDMTYLISTSACHYEYSSCKHECVKFFLLSCTVVIYKSARFGLVQLEIESVNSVMYNDVR